MKLLKKTSYVDLFQVSEKAYAAISNNILTMSNAGFIDLGDKVVVFDTFLSLEASRELKELVYEFTHPKQILVVNSHAHLDHFLGNSAFLNEVIIASLKSYETLIKNDEPLEFGEKYQKDIDYLTNELKKDNDLEKKNELSNSLVIVTNLRNEENKLVLPNLIISDDATIIGEKGALELQVLEKAHSAGDIIGLIRNDKVCFTGDLVFSGEHPYIGVGDPLKLIQQLKALYDSEYDYFIPGHGKICGKEELLNQIEYIENVMDIVKVRIDETEKISIFDLKEKFHHIVSTPFRWNIKFLKEYFKNNS